VPFLAEEDETGLFVQIDLLPARIDEAVGAAGQESRNRSPDAT
jgi:hypothetical protein